MKTIVVFRMVPDVVEELEIAADGKSLDQEYLRLMPAEADNHALEQALIIKERHGGTVTVVGEDAPGLDETLFSALCKGADQAIRLTSSPLLGTHARAYRMGQALRESPGLLPADLILTGAQAIDDLDGLLAPMLATFLKLPFLGTVTRLTVDPAAGIGTATREFAGGVRGEYEIKLPLVIGIQAAEKPPRYVPVAKLRALMKARTLEDIQVNGFAGGIPTPDIRSMRKPEETTQAEMFEGPLDQVAGKLADTLFARGLL